MICRPKPKKRGFTLIELIIVIVVIGLLAGLVVPKFTGISRDAQVTALIQDIDTLEKVIPVYHTKHHVYPLAKEEPEVFEETSPFLMAVKAEGETGQKLYKIDLQKTKPYHSKLKYGHEKTFDDYFVYSMDTGRVYYVKGVLNGEGKLAYGNGLSSSFLRNLKLGDILLQKGKVNEVKRTEYTLSGEVSVNETVSVTVNNETVPVTYDDAHTFAGTKIYAGENNYKTFFAHINLDKSKSNKIEIVTSSKKETFTVAVTKIAVKQISAGFGINAVLLEDGTVWTWGGNDKGQLGIGNNINQFTPTQVSGINDIKQISVSDSSANGGYMLALKNDGTVWGWGGSLSWQLGARIDAQLTPMQIQGMDDVKQVIAGNYESIAVKNDGTVWTWGNSNRTKPVQVAGINDVKQLINAQEHFLALKNDGTLWAWGSNGFGQLGVSGIKHSSVPIQITTVNNIKQIASNGYNSIVVQNDGTVWAWGHGHQTIPAKLEKIDNVNQIFPFPYYTMAVKKDGTVWGWGNNLFGQLGIGNTTNQSVPVQLTTIKNIKQMDGGQYTTIALLDDGTIWTWGYNGEGQLGIGDSSIEYQAEPVQVSEFGN